jgi:hypothetical protein
LMPAANICDLGFRKLDTSRNCHVVFSRSIVFLPRASAPVALFCILFR